MAKSALTMEVTGIQETLNAFRRIFDDVDTSQILINGLMKIGFEIKAKAQDILQEKVYGTKSGDYVRTGLLQANISPSAGNPIEIAKGRGQIGATIKAKQFYAVYVELGVDYINKKGTRVKMSPRAFLLPAAQAEAGEALKILTEALTDFLKLKAKG